MDINHQALALANDLSDREWQVFIAIAHAKTSAEIADELGLTRSSVSTYRKRILKKLGLHNNVELALAAVAAGLLALPGAGAALQPQDS